MITQEIKLTRGFLPEQDPLKELPANFNLWDELGQELPKLLLSDNFQDKIKALPILAVNDFTNAQLERAMMLLSFFGHAYVWAVPGTLKIPSAIAVPWYEVSQKLHRPPVLSYASYALHNWQRLDADRPIELGNIVLLQNFLGGLDEEWFVLVHVDIEMKASSALQLFFPIQTAVASNDAEILVKHLTIVQQCLEKMCLTLDCMPLHCDPYIYYNRVRPYIHGWKNNPSLPEGLIYEGVSAFNNMPQQFRGETGAQSSIIPAFDALFGIGHHPDPLRVYLMEMRNYMPLSHRKFIEQIENNGSIRDYVLKAYRSVPVLQELYNSCISYIGRFRQTHLNYAAHYIQKQSQSSMANPTAIGTGGTPFMEYLKKHKDETLQYLI